MSFTSSGLLIRHAPYPADIAHLKKKIAKEKNKLVICCFFIKIIGNLWSQCQNPGQLGILENSGQLSPLGTTTVEIYSIWKRCDHTSRISQRLGIMSSKLYNQRSVIWEGKLNSGDDTCLRGKKVKIWLESYEKYEIDTNCGVLQSYSLSFVVNSLSLALADLIKSQATIIGVKQMSQLYFLTKDLNASLWKEKVVNDRDAIVCSLTKLAIFNPKLSHWTHCSLPEERKNKERNTNITQNNIWLPLSWQTVADTAWILQIFLPCLREGGIRITIWFKTYTHTLSKFVLNLWAPNLLSS